jgi:hypothetical protein
MEMLGGWSHTTPQLAFKATFGFHVSARAEQKPERRLKRGKNGYRFAKRSAPLDHPVVEAPFWFSDDRAKFRAAYHAEDEWSLEGFRHKFHQLLYGEVETTDRMGKMLAECPELPWEMRVELAHQMWDEARHIEIVAKACEEELGAQLGYGPWPLIWWWMQNETDPLSGRADRDLLQRRPRAAAARYPLHLPQARRRRHAT